jgi:hypothetical protein
MLLTTIGSDYWPRSPEGRILCLLLAIIGPRVPFPKRWADVHNVGQP